MSFLKTLIAGAFLTSAISACVDNQRDLSNKTTKPPKDQFFPYETMQKISLDINYSFEGDDYFVLFELYDQNPIETNEEDGSWIKKEIKPLYSGSTDYKGKFADKILLPSDISEIWLSSDYLGTISPIKLAIENNHISFDQNAYIKTFLQQSGSKTRGETANKHTYLNDWNLMEGVDWDENGRPSNVSSQVNVPPASVLYNIKYVFKKGDGKNISNYFPQFFDGSMVSDVPIIKKTKIYLSFVQSSASLHNAVGYYTYPTGEVPTKENIRKVLAFPNASPIYKNKGVGALVCGDEVQLKYWDGAKYVDEFPVGVTIGWCMQANGFITESKNGSLRGDIAKGMGIRYSTTDLNDVSKDGTKKQRTISLRDTESNQIVAIGFEDNIDNDYADAIFYIRTSEEGAVDGNVPALPEDPVPPKDVDNSISYSGTLSFEDLWPTEGDYDMNDVMIKYTSKVYRMVLTNRVFKIVDKFVPLHSGGTLRNGFGYQLQNLSNNDIRKITIEGSSYSPPSSFMENTGKGDMESGQTHPTILLFDDMTVFKGKDKVPESEKEYTVTIELNDIEIKEIDIAPPYNPFIYVESDIEGRKKEVHLINYPPTDKADISLLGTGKDVSRPEEKLYYVSKDMMPFAINIPSVTLVIPSEGIRIDETYPKFTEWASSQGKKNKDWYKYPKK